MKDRVINYTVSGPTLAAFHASEAFIRIIRGPVRSGSSVACANEIFKHCNQQKKVNGEKRSRWAIVRNTYGELKDTTLKTWLDWFPEDIFGKFNKVEMTHYLKYEDINAEILFRALDRPDDIKHLLSLELTGAWFNEMREIEQAVVNTMTERVGQYPAKKDGGSNFFGIIGDTNPPDDDNFLYILAEEERPIGWDFFHQPGALMEVDGEFIPNPKAENVHNLNEGMEYYLKRVHGKSKAHIRIYYCAQYGFIQDGRAVHEDYVDSTHCAEEILKPTHGLPLSFGLDFGLTPAMALGQKQLNGQWIIFDEFVATRMGIANFADEVMPILRSEYKGFDFNIGKGDPAGVEAAQTDEQNVYDILEQKGLFAERAWHNNDTVIRRESLSRPLTRMIDGKPGILISPKCKILRKALAGGFCYKRVQVSGDKRFKDKPAKNKYSHIAEALEYLLLGEGEGDSVIAIKKKEETPEEIKEQRRMQHNFENQEQGWMV